MTCPNCGVELDNGVTECYLCGYIFSYDENQADSNYDEELNENINYNADNICPTCGYTLNETDDICPICGTQIERKSLSNEEATINSEEKLSENTDAELTDKVKTENKPKAPLKTSLIIVIVLCVVLCCVVCLMAHALFNNKKEDKNTSSNTNSSSVTTVNESSIAETTTTVTTQTTTSVTSQTTTSKKTKKSVSENFEELDFEPYIIRVINPTSIYDIPSYNGKITGTIDDGLKYTIVKEFYDSSNELWGKLKSGMGWININQATYNIKNEEPNVWCPVCGEGFFTTGIGNDGLTCPSCRYNWFPNDSQYTNNDDNYIWSEYSIKSDLGGASYLDSYTKEEIQTFINEILARNGYKFKDQKWINYFSYESWYSPDTSSLKNAESRFNSYEKENYYYLAKYRDNM